MIFCAGRYVDFKRKSLYLIESDISSERCRSGLTGAPGERVYLWVPWVRIPPFPQSDKPESGKSIPNSYISKEHPPVSTGGKYFKYGTERFR